MHISSLTASIDTDWYNTGKVIRALWSTHKNSFLIEHRFYLKIRHMISGKSSITFDTHIERSAYPKLLVWNPIGK